MEVKGRFSFKGIRLPMATDVKDKNIEWEKSLL